ncbi:MAG: tetratricopeptide repeat protein [Betaproteobacteria bacterium]
MKPVWNAALITVGMMSLPILCASVGASAATLSTVDSVQVPLTGSAYLLADAAYKAYARRDYTQAVAKTREALRLRPDSKQLASLLKKAEDAKGTQRAGKSTSQKALPPPPTPSPAFLAADAAYKSYARADYANATASAKRAVQLAPKNRDYRLLLVNSLSAAKRITEAEQAISDGIAQAGDDGRLAAIRASIRNRVTDTPAPISVATATAVPRDAAFDAATAAYKAFDEKDFVLAVGSARQAVTLSPQKREYQLLLVNSLFRTGEYAEAERVADVALAADSNDAALLAQRGFIRQHLDKEAMARSDFEAALRVGNLPVVTEIGLLADLDRKGEAKRRFERAQTDREFANVLDVDVAYLAVRVGKDDDALAAFNRADAAGKLPNTSYQDAAFAAVRALQDDAAIGYFKRAIDDTNRGDALKLRMEPQLLFNTRRAVAEVSRTFGVITSLSYRGAVSGLGPAPGTRSATDSLQAGVEIYWRPFGYRNGRYTELFARAFETLYNKGGGATGGDTLQSALGIRHKPFSQTNVVVSLSRVFTPSGRNNDWLAQIGYSGGSGTDLRVDAPSWWTTRVAAEAGRYLSARQSYALANVETGKSFRMNSESMWVLFPHLALAADYDSTASEQSAFGIGPGLNARYWFRDDIYNAPRSYLDTTLQYRFRIGGAARAEGVFLNTTLLY